jgi:hypothetical protein
MRKFAKRLIDFEAQGNGTSPQNVFEFFDVCEKLRPQLATLMGNAGYRALLWRALALASAEVPWLRAVHVKPDGALGGLEEIHPQLSSDALLVGRVALLAQLLSLLVEFIGENLTQRLAREVWPEGPFNDSGLSRRY